MDKTGNRRFWVIPVPAGHVIPTELLQEERDAIWSAAVKAYKSGEKWWLSRDIEQNNEANNSSFEFVDEWEGEIEKYISQWDKVYISEILSTVFKIDIALQDRITQMRVSNILTKLGWRKSGREHIAGKKVMMWEKIKSEEKVCLSMSSNSVTKVQQGLQAGHTSEEQKTGGMSNNSVTKVQQGLQAGHTSEEQKQGGMSSIKNNMDIPQSEVCPEVCPTSNPQQVKDTETVDILRHTSQQNSKLSKNKKKNIKKFWVKVSKDIVSSGVLIDCFLDNGFVFGRETGQYKSFKVHASDCEFHYE